MERIRKSYPEHRILAEERGLESRGESPYQWVIDPLDGTINYALHFACWLVAWLSNFTNA